MVGSVPLSGAILAGQSRAATPEEELPRTAVLTHVFPIELPDDAQTSTPPPPPRQRLSCRTPLANGDSRLIAAVEALRVGDVFHGFALVEELGQGAFARVFLARQQALAGRLVVLKVSRRPTREAERLARLQHTNVVPVYSIHDVPPLQIICMPFLGRRTIADVLRQHRQRLEHDSASSTRDRSSWPLRWRSTAWNATSKTALAITKPSSFAAAANDPSAAEISLVGQPLAVLRLLSQLSAGLQHAHERGILHLDIKPANVLLADTGEPMLFDFNLSFDAAEKDRELIGGTLAYMAIEQLEDMRSRGQCRIDARTDLYALGVMAWEMLTGEVPFPACPRGLADLDQLIAARQTELPSLRQLNPAVTPAVEAIVRKLLAPNPDDRYQSAAELKTDIDRHLADLPLLYTREPSLGERFQKWRRRNPRLLRRLTVAASVLLAALTAGVTYHYVQTQAVAAARAKFHALIPRIQSVHIELLVHGEYTWQQKGQQHAFELLQEYGLPYDPNWRERPEFQRLPALEQQELSAAFAELLLLVAQSRWQEDRARPEPARRQAAAELLELNRYAQSLYPAGHWPPLLIRQHRELVAALQEAAVETASLPAPRTYREHYLEAAADILADRFQEALERLEPLVAQRPDDGLVHFWIAFCRQQLNYYENAVDRYDLAASLLPHDARPVFFRGTVRSQMLLRQLAEREYTHALWMSPNEPLYYRLRGMIRWRLHKYDEAEQDLNQAIALDPDDIQAYLYRSWVRQARGDRAGAHADLQAAFSFKPRTAGDHVARGLEMIKTRPQEALAEFQAAEALQPHSVAALYNQVHILLSMGKFEQALVASERLITRCPDYALGWTIHGMVLAHLHRREEAHAAVHKALKISHDMNVLLQGAAVYALTSQEVPADAELSIDLLEHAFRSGFRRFDLLKRNKVYALLQQHPRYQQLTTAAQQLFTGK